VARAPTLIGGVGANRGDAVLDRTGGDLERQENISRSVQELLRFGPARQLQANVETCAHPSGILAMALGHDDVQRRCVEMLSVGTECRGKLGTDSAGGHSLPGLLRSWSLSGQLGDETARRMVESA